MSRLLPLLTSTLFVVAASAAPGAVVLPLQSGDAPASAGPPHYQVREVARSAWGLAIPNDINDHGVVVGEMDMGAAFPGPRHAVVWADGQTIDLTPDDAIVLGTAQAVNNQGVVAGRYVTNGAYVSGGFRWHDGVFDVLPTFAPGYQQGFGVSERGYVLGQAMNTQFKVNPTIWDPDLVPTDLGSFGVGLGMACDANGWDVVVGGTPVGDDDLSAFLWKDGSMTLLGALSGHPFAVAFAVNNRNEVVGYSGKTLDDHAFYWSRATGMVELPNLGGVPWAWASDINDDGYVVGYSYATPTLGSRVAALWHRGVPYDLNQLLVDGQGWHLFEARGINELGQIVGFGRHDGVDVAYLLTPLDQPMTTVIGPFPGQAGASNTIEVVGATPGAELAVLIGATLAQGPLDGAEGVVVDIAAPQKRLLRADADGRACLRLDLPAELAGTRLAVQAVDLSNLDVSNLAVRTLD